MSKCFICMSCQTALDKHEVSIESDRRSIGNATDFTAWMIRHANDPNITGETHSMLYANWNLDSDRGYGYLAWKGTVPHADSFTVEDEEYLS